MSKFADAITTPAQTDTKPILNDKYKLGIYIRNFKHGKFRKKI